MEKVVFCATVRAQLVQAKRRANIVLVMVCAVWPRATALPMLSSLHKSLHLLVALLLLAEVKRSIQRLALALLDTQKLHENQAVLLGLGLSGNLSILGFCIVTKSQCKDYL